MGKKRLFLSSLYLGVFLSAAGTAFYYLQCFDGTVFLLPGVAERLAFCPADRSVRPGVAQRGVTPDRLLFDNPNSAKALRPNQAYDTLVLPFAIRLDGAELLTTHQPREMLYIEGPGESRAEAIAVGSQVALGLDALTVDTIGPWEGLVRDPASGPMAVVDIPKADGTPGQAVFLEPGSASILRPDLAVCFFWSANEPEARSAFIPSLEEVPGARWGVRDGPAVQWFENFIPGTGVIRRDGTQVTLSGASRSAGYITIAVQRSVGQERIRVSANAADEEAPFIYEDPSGTGQVLCIHAWREDQAIGRLLRRNAPPQEFAMALGEGDAPVVLRQVMAHALPVPGGKIRAARVTLGDTSKTLREGLAETLGDYRLRYQTEAVPPDARYRVTFLSPNGATLKEGVLQSGTSIRQGGWVFSLSPENPFAPQGVALTAERPPGGLGQIVGLAIFVFGSLGLVVARFARRS